ncbi:M15 family metallopeptidase [Flagellimonas sp. 389]|uniref:M15 family metallopeptidase n=1 Tax=Flagellimonas sp. 389 TaxID=2835862 RepID=UPI001BD65447|nr:M15 family metallopeptidase [Flagellimonas sp. 389]MBS9464217.1 M15 family metallopeptidase [Flagellimonas sp. 389]
MNRRSFIKKTSISSLACTLPTIMPMFQDKEYSTLELMGKEKIQLFGQGINLREAAFEAFTKMKRAAFTAGFDIKMVSSYRDFYRQEGIWERKYLRYTEDDGMQPMDAIDKIIEYSTIPGTSRHHWGTDIDIIDGNAKNTGDVLVPEKFEAGGPFEDFKLWLDENSEKYDFHLVYTDEPKRRGFKYEPWHYSYAPISISMLKAFRKVNIMKLLQTEEFYGAEHFTTGFLRTYIQNNILDINRNLL